MCRLAPLIGSELTEKFFLTRYLDLCEDNDMMVRKICAIHFAEMCTAVGKEKLYSKLVSLIRRYKNGKPKGASRSELIVPFNLPIISAFSLDSYVC